jgi:hypothetical protein
MSIQSSKPKDLVLIVALACRNNFLLLLKLRLCPIVEYLIDCVRPMNEEKVYYWTRLGVVKRLSIVWHSLQDSWPNATLPSHVQLPKL